MCQLYSRLLLILLATGLTASTLSAQTEDRVQASCPLHLIIALDFSGSERAYLGEIQTVLHALTNKYELHETNLKIGIITFNRGAQVVLPLTGDTEKLERAIDELRIPRTVYATDIHAGISLANEEFRRNSVASIPKYFVLVSDGDPHAHMRGFGYQEDLVNMDRLKLGDPDARVDPVHVFCLYTGRLSPYHDRFSEDIRKASIHHMETMASDPESFFYYREYPKLVNFFDMLTSCF